MTDIDLDVGRTTTWQPLWPDRDDELDRTLLADQPWSFIIDRWVWTVRCVLAHLEIIAPQQLVSYIHVKTISLAALNYDGKDSFERCLSDELLRTWSYFFPRILKACDDLPVKLLLLEKLYRAQQLGAFVYAVYEYKDLMTDSHPGVPLYVYGRLNDVDLGRLLGKSPSAVRVAAKRARDNYSKILKEQMS